MPVEDSTVQLKRDTALDIPSVELVVTDGPDRGARARLGHGRARIGTAQGSELLLRDATVSRVHCEVHVKGAGVSVVDLGSTNGTFVEGTRVRDADLAPGVKVRVGGTVLIAEFGAEPEHIPLSPRDRFGDLLGASVSMRRVYAVLEKIAPTDATILVRGETGTGKELVARAIHEASRRANKPFVAVDCGAIAENLIESELFGHAKGSFSGAVNDRRGLFEEAEGGTLFLDEIGELPVALQPKLLRALEAREIRRVGTNTVKRVDVRVVAATNRPLAQRVNDGLFREDLYYRLAIVEIELPPLRARREDIPALAQSFFLRFAGEGKPPKDLVAQLIARSWPGNVRELRNFIEKRVLLDWGDAAAPDSHALPPAGLDAFVRTDMPLKEARDAWVEQFELAYVRALFQKTGGNVTRAAGIAGVNRRYLYRVMTRLGVTPSDAGDDE